ncbi:DUF397 domain-containing protein [Streptomyces sp. NPDC048415]|uniref:DUF397 domain-containing protein n=1 Tax=Streptomyces sp. NPDC048415 TaxID=3154822 RepID=UPI00343CA4BD
MPSGSDAVPDAAWFKSSYSGGNETECVECARVGDRTLVRDSKTPDGPEVSIPAHAWQSFVWALLGWESLDR